MRPATPTRGGWYCFSSSKLHFVFSAFFPYAEKCLSSSTQDLVWHDYRNRKPPWEYLMEFDNKMIVSVVDCFLVWKYNFLTFTLLLFVPTALSSERVEWEKPFNSNKAPLSRHFLHFPNTLSSWSTSIVPFTFSCFFSTLLDHFHPHFTSTQSHSPFIGDQRRGGENIFHHCHSDKGW